MAKKRGRPATGRDPALPLRAPRELRDRINEWMDAHPEVGANRSVAIRCLIDLGLRNRVSSALIDPKTRDAAQSGKRGRLKQNSTGLGLKYLSIPPRKITISKKPKG